METIHLYLRRNVMRYILQNENTEDFSPPIQ